MASKISTVLPVEAIGTAVPLWAKILRTEPTFVDGDRWAQFDVGGARLSLAGSDRASAIAGVMVKVEDLDVEHTRLTDAQVDAGAISVGLHERRFTVTADGGTVTFYQSI